MLHVGGIRAHGGQGADAGEIPSIPQLNAVFRGTSRMIRVWDGHGDAEELTVNEARELCARGDQALMLANPNRRTDVDFMIDSEAGTLQCLTLPRQWLIAFLAAMRRALRTADTAHALAPKPYCVDSLETPMPDCVGADGAPQPQCIDTHSDPGSWGRHLRHTAPLRGVDADSS